MNVFKTFAISFLNGAVENVSRKEILRTGFLAQEISIYISLRLKMSTIETILLENCVE